MPKFPSAHRAGMVWKIALISICESVRSRGHFDQPGHVDVSNNVATFQDQPVLWQRPQHDLAPGRVKRDIGSVSRAIGNPASPPKPSGYPQGRSKDKNKESTERFRIIRKGPNQRSATFLRIET